MKPSANELQKALAKAEAMRDKNDDDDFLSKSFLYLYQRLEMLEKVNEAANRYMHFGQVEHGHADLLHALEAAREIEGFEKMEDKEDFGL